MENISKRPYTSSRMAFDRAQKSIPGGVNSPVRAFKSVGGTPIFMESAKGSKLVDVDGDMYIDYINSWGPMILGHCHEEVVDAIKDQASRSISFGTPTEAESEMAELVKSMAPNIDLLRLVSSGTEACMSALRLARGHTGRNKFIKFEGNYHGHADPFLIKSGSGLATFDIQEVPGVTGGTAVDTLIATYNDIDQVKNIMEAHPDEVAAIIVEPVAGNMGCIPPVEGFLEGLRTLCDEHGSILIFDEVMTGFRLAPGGAQERFNIKADLVTYGKVIGGGLPVGAFGGSQEIMNSIAPVGQVYQAGTLSGNPIAVKAGMKTLSILNQSPEIYARLEDVGNRLKEEISTILNDKNISYSINHCGSMISVHFGQEKVENFKDAASCDIDLFNRFFHHMLSSGIYLPPSAYESWFLSNSISEEDIDKTLTAIRKFEF